MANQDEEKSVNKGSQVALLKEIRDDFTYYCDEWREIREEAKTDMRYVAGDPWDPKDRQFREDHDRPCMTWDELSPYINQLVNDPRQNKRAIKVSPAGAGADDDTAELRGNIIRAIEYNSKAQSAYTTGFQGAAERSYGYWRIGKRFVSGETGAARFNQELYIGRIPNPDTVYPDPDCKEIDTSDAMGYFVTDSVRRKDFKRRFPSATITDFTGDHEAEAPGWVTEKIVRVAEAWRVDMMRKTLHLVENKEGPTVLFEDELPLEFDNPDEKREWLSKNSKRQRQIETRLVTQYITNGLEILDETEIEIPWIPIAAVFGKELYVDEGGGSHRQLISLVRMARDPFMFYCFARSQEAEEAGLTPKVPYIGYTGQFETNKSDWQMANKIPLAYLQADPVMDATGTQLLPLPKRQEFQPNFQAYEIACEAARRAIQTAMGGSNLPTAAQRRSEKSGVALKEIEAEEDRGTFHFIDNFNMALEHTGRILDAWIPFVYDTKREIGIRKADETQAVIRINDPEFEEKDASGQSVKKLYDATKGEHGVTISTGPAAESQRAEASDFVDTLVSNLQAIAQMLPPGAAAKILSLSIKLKTLGPIGQEMADTISPPPDKQAEQQQMQQLQGQAQQSQQVIAELQAELQKLQMEKAGKVIQGEYQKQLAQMSNDIKVLVALIEAKNQNAAQEMEMYKQFYIENHGAAHEVGMQAKQHEHEASQAQVAQAAAAQQQETAPTDAGAGQ